MIFVFYFYIFGAMKHKLSFIAVLFSFIGFSQDLVTSNEISSKSNNLAFENLDKNSSFNLTDKRTHPIQLLDVSQNIEEFSSSKITVSDFPLTKPEFKADSSPKGWTDLHVSAVIKVKSAANLNLVDVDGFTQINNVSGESSYQFAIGVFVDNQLKIVKEFNENSKGGTCNSATFDLSGVFENLSVGEHTVKVYAYNLPKTSSNYSAITYGGSASGSCSLLDNEDAKIHLSVQYSE